LKDQTIASVVATPEAEAVTVVAHVFEEIAVVPNAAVPLATVTVTVPLVGNMAVEFCPLPPCAVGSGEARCVAVT
jgi:hypothetical protein